MPMRTVHAAAHADTLDGSLTQPLPASTLLLSGFSSGWLATDEAQEKVCDAAQGFGRLVDVRVDADHGLMRITYSRLDEAVFAKGQLDSGVFGEGEWKSTIAAAFAQQEDGAKRRSMMHLQVPALTKQFLISPPASPPIGWEPVVEDPPVVNEALVDAIMGMELNVPYEVHAAKPGLPAICVVNCSSPSPSHTPLEDEVPQLSTLPCASPRPSIVFEDSDEDVLESASMVLKSSGDGLRGTTLAVRHSNHGLETFEGRQGTAPLLLRAHHFCVAALSSSHPSPSFSNSNATNTAAAGDTAIAWRRCVLKLTCWNS